MISRAIRSSAWTARRRPFAVRYAASVVIVGLAVLARWFLEPVLMDRQAFPTFYVSVTAAAWWGGLGPTLLALVLGYLAGDWFFVRPQNTFSALNLANTGIYGFVGLAIAFFTQMLHAAQDRAEANAEESRGRQRELEREILERRRVEAEREQLLQELTTARARLEAVLRQMPAGVVIAEAPSGRIVLANDQTHRIFGTSTSLADGAAAFDLGRLRGKDGRPYLPHEWPLERSLNAGEEVKGEEIRYPRRGDAWGSMTVSSVPIRDQEDIVVAAVAILHDISARTRAEEALLLAHEELERRVAERTADLARANESLRTEVNERRRIEQARKELLHRLVAVQVEERVRIARELHDQMGQQLTALKLGLEALAQPLADGNGDSSRLARLLALTRHIGRDMHRIAWERGPAVLGELALPEALSNHAEEWSGHSGVPVHVQSTGHWESRLPSQVETTLYRVVQEALTNVAKYARASRVSLVLNRGTEDVLVIVEDDGVGFNAELATETPQPRRRMGLVGMHERVQSVGGVLHIESTPGGGTTLFVRVPIRIGERAANDA